MAWSSPLTAVTNATLTAAQWNASVRDNLLETAPAKATAAERLIVTNGANTVREQPADLNSWTPSWGTWNMGDSSIAASYRIIAGVMFWRLRAVLGASAAPSGALSFTMPFSVAGGQGNVCGWGIIWDAGTANNRKPVVVRAGSAMTMNVFSGETTGSQVTATAPFTFVATDELAFSGATLLSSQTWQP